MLGHWLAYIRVSPSDSLFVTSIKLYYGLWTNGVRRGVGLKKEPKETVFCTRYMKPNLCFGMEVFELSVPVYKHVFNIGGNNRLL